MLAQARAAERALQRATAPEKVIKIEAKLDGIETWMHRANLFDTESIRPVNESRMRACWKLGQLLAHEHPRAHDRGAAGHLALDAVGGVRDLNDLGPPPRWAPPDTARSRVPPGRQEFPAEAARH